MAKSRLIDIIPVLFIIEGASLIIYGLVTGANFMAIVFALISDYPLSVKEFYVILGMGRTILAIEMKKINTRAGMIVVGILFIFSSIAGVAYYIYIGDITAPTVYVIAIEFIAMFSLSLYYLIYALTKVSS